MKLEKQDEELINSLSKLRHVTKKEVKEVEYIMKKYIDPKASICVKCTSQIRFSHKRMMRWYDEYKKQQVTSKEEEVSDKHVCRTCGKELTDKRRKYCNNTCKNK